MYVDVNFGPGKAQRIVVYENDTAEELAIKFATENSMIYILSVILFLIDLDDHLRGKLKLLLEGQMSGILSKIEEEMFSMQSESDIYYNNVPAPQIVNDN